MDKRCNKTCAVLARLATRPSDSPPVANAPLRPRRVSNKTKPHLFQAGQAVKLARSQPSERRAAVMPLPTIAAILLVIASGAAAAAAWVAVLAWWKALLILILLIWAGLLLKKWHKCRGDFFATVGGCIMAILVVTRLGKTTAERVARAVTMTNIHYDPELRKKRGKWKIRQPQRRNSSGRRVSLLETCLFDLETLTHTGSATWPLMCSTLSSWVSSSIYKEAVR